jgi:hypothetical protein
LLKQNLINQRIISNWHNCYSFGNGVESNRIRDNYNQTYISNGVKASTTLSENYKQERRKYSLIYSGIYNSTSGVNSLNQFVAAEKITKEINPTYGSIQKLKAGWGGSGDLIALCEDRILKILANKDALFNADGDTNVTATNRVLGTATPYSGEYGISTNPESFASESYRAYFTDKVRGSVMRLSRDGLTAISDAGMKDWFRDNLKLNDKLVGSYDDKKDEYNLSLPSTNDGGGKSVTYKENVRGWVSFKSFVTLNGISCANEYYTFKDGDLFKHNHDVPGNRNTFYGVYTNTTFNVILNEAPGSVKSFYTLNYEGSKSRVVLNVSDGDYYNLTPRPGWYVDNIFTNKEEGSLLEFIEKEGKWFNYIRGKDISYDANSNIILNSDGNSLFDQSSFAIQGLGAVGGVSPPLTIYGCTNPLATNYSAVATIDDGSCIMPQAVAGCTMSTADNYDPTATIDNGNCQWGGCTDPAAINYVGFPGEAQTYVANPGYGIYDDGSCGGYVLGCTDVNAQNYDATATVDDGSCIPHVYGCLGIQDPATGQVLVAATEATNYNPNATMDDGSCIWSYCNIAADANGDAIDPTNIADNVSQWTGYVFTSGYYTANDCISGGCLADPTAPNYGCFPGNTAYPCNDPVLWDDGSCNAPISGCTDATACNYDPTATLDDGSCIYPDGCTDPTASNYDPNATVDDGSCIACVYGCTDANATNYDATATCDDGSCIPFTYGCMDPTAVNYNPSVSSDDGSCEYTGCTDPTADNYDSAATIDDGSCTYNPGCTDPTASNYDPSADIDDGSCTYIYGCTDPSYIEYNASATIDDGSCSTLIVTGCTDPTAFNYDPTANVDDGSCVPVILGCMDPAALNYNFTNTTNPNEGGPIPNTDNGHCFYTCPTYTWTDPDTGVTSPPHIGTLNNPIIISGAGNMTTSVSFYLGHPNVDVCSPDCYPYANPPGLPVYNLWVSNIVNAQGEDILAPGWHPNYAPYIGNDYLTMAAAGGGISWWGIPAGTYTFEFNDVWGCPVFGPHTHTIVNSPGCTDPSASNYCNSCNVDDGSCIP